MDCSEETLRRRLDRAQERIRILETTIEDKTRELYQEHQRLERSHEYLVAVIDTMQSFFFVLDEQLKIKLVNLSVCNRLNWKKEELIGVPVTRVLPVQFLSEIITFDGEEKLEERGKDLTLTTKEGKPVPVLVSYSPLYTGEKKNFNLVIVASDLSKYKDLETQLQHAQKLEAIGQLSAGVAHEINTPIQYVGDNTHFVQEAFGELKEILSAYQELEEKTAQTSDCAEINKKIQEAKESADFEFIIEEIPESLKQSLEGVEKVATIVSAMKEFSHPGSKERQFVQINKILESAVVISRNEWKYKSECSTSFADNLPDVPCYPNELSQVLLNLLINAAHAINESLEGSDDTFGQISVSSSLEGDRIKIEISDNGCGIPEGIQSRIFEPFFTTKEVGKGTGQGLALAHNIIVKKHLGEIGFKSKEGEGTTFFILLPTSVQ